MLEEGSYDFISSFWYEDILVYLFDNSVSEKTLDVSAEF